MRAGCKAGAIYWPRMSAGPTSRKNEPIRTWRDGDTVQGFALLIKKELRHDRGGRDYLDLELVDASGSIGGKVWTDSPAMRGVYEAHRFIAFRGRVQTYRDQLQLVVEECREAVPETDRDHGFDEASLIPTTPYDIADLYARLVSTLDHHVTRPVLRRLAQETLEEHGPALREHPAAKTIHHAYRGGLLEHTVSMLELGARLCDHYPELDRDLVLLGVLFHDLGKLQELGAMPANDYTLAGRLVGHVVLGRDLLRERCAAIPGFPDDLRLLLEHLILSHQGEREYGAAVEPMTAEALALHFIDDLDSKLQQLRAARRAGPAVQYSRGLGRHVYLGAVAPEIADRPEPEGVMSADGALSEELQLELGDAER